MIAYYKFRLKWDKINSLYRINVEAKMEGEDIFKELCNTKYVLAYNNIPPARNLQKDYSIEYETLNYSPALIRFVTWIEEHSDVRIAVSTVITNDCMLFKTKHEGLFEVYIFKDMKHKQDDLYQMFVNGDLQNEINSIFDGIPF